MIQAAVEKSKFNFGGVNQAIVKRMRAFMGDSAIRALDRVIELADNGTFLTTFGLLVHTARMLKREGAYRIWRM